MEHPFLVVHEEEGLHHQDVAHAFASGLAVRWDSCSLSFVVDVAAVTADAIAAVANYAATVVVAVAAVVANAVGTAKIAAAVAALSNTGCLVVEASTSMTPMPPAVVVADSAWAQTAPLGQKQPSAMGPWGLEGTLYWCWVAMVELQKNYSGMEWQLGEPAFAFAVVAADTYCDTAVVAAAASKAADVGND